MTDLPNWVYDVVIALEHWRDTHPNLYTSSGGVEGYFRTEKCGCEALDHVPKDVLERAKAIAAYVSDADHQRERMGVPVCTGEGAEQTSWVVSGPATVYQPDEAGDP